MSNLLPLGCKEHHELLLVDLQRGAATAVRNGSTTPVLSRVDKPPPRSRAPEG